MSGMLHVFIINSFAGDGSFSGEIRSALEKKENFNYLVFNSEYAGHEGILARQIYDLFADERIRFYCCGGSGLFRNVLDAIPDIERVEFVECPYGYTNDFQAIFGKQRESFKKLDNLINGKVVKFDYIKTNLGVAHNTISTGFDIDILQMSKKLELVPFSIGKVMYAIAGIITLFRRSYVKVRVFVDGIDYSGSYEQITIANGKRLGGMFKVSEDGNARDGKLNVVMFPRRNFITKCKQFFALISGNEKYLKTKCINLSACKIDIYTQGNKEFIGNFDGELVRGEHMSAEVEKCKLRYVIPTDVEI